MGKNHNIEEFSDPELEYTDNSEIAAAVDVSTFGTDNIFRPVYINQGEEILALTPEDTKRLLEFLKKADKFLESFKGRIIQ